MKETIKRKLTSRKVFILAIWLFFAGVALFNKNIATETKDIIFSFTGSISLAYYGANVFQKRLYCANVGTQLPTPGTQEDGV
jgi:hypothetical protein